LAGDAALVESAPAPTGRHPQASPKNTPVYPDVLFFQRIGRTESAGHKIPARSITNIFRRIEPQGNKNRRALPALLAWQSTPEIPSMDASKCRNFCRLSGNAGRIPLLVQTASWGKVNREKRSITLISISIIDL
jgi:hypothetical protein